MCMYLKIPMSKKVFKFEAFFMISAEKHFLLGHILRSVQVEELAVNFLNQSVSTRVTDPKICQYFAVISPENLSFFHVLSQHLLIQSH